MMGCTTPRWVAIRHKSIHFSLTLVEELGWPLRPKLFFVTFSMPDSKAEHYLARCSVKQGANIILLLMMLVAVYSHYMVNDKFERIAPALVRLFH
uniref:Uncharacterized protein n=1 Tax=Timema shepardi TaxID=629360 RepID=A0A7R9AZX5_TIMSH|nr:unnamed protein product [Timema shepardi]